MLGSQVKITQPHPCGWVIFFDETRNPLYLIEAVTSHGPVSHKRLLELEQLLEKSTAKRVYVSAFLLYNDYRKYIKQIAWNTDIWIAEIPDHMIHHNGDKFMSLHG